MNMNILFVIFLLLTVVTSVTSIKNAAAFKKFSQTKGNIDKCYNKGKFCSSVYKCCSNLTCKRGACS